MGYKAVNFHQKFALINEQWQPKVVAEMNEYQFKLVKLRGDFVWHAVQIPLQLEPAVQQEGAAESRLYAEAVAPSAW